MKNSFTGWFGFELEYIEASGDTKIKYRNFHFYDGKGTFIKAKITKRKLNY